MRPKNQKLQNI